MTKNFVPAPPFSIGLKPLQAENMLQLDEDLLPFRAEIKALYNTIFEDVCQAEPDTIESQSEASALIETNLKAHHKSRYSFDDGNAHCLSSGEIFEPNSNMPIASAGLLIPEDLVLMRRDDTGWRLVAASLAFPSSWNLREKFSKPLEAVHGPVPIPKQMSDRINRIFDNLQPNIPVWRANWSLDGDGDLRHDRPTSHRESRRAKLAGEVFLRTEFQTLHKLPQSQDILFTIRIKTRPIISVLDDANGRKALAILHDQFMAMSDAERDYKGINENAEGFINWMAKIGEFNRD